MPTNPAPGQPFRICGCGRVYKTPAAFWRGTTFHGRQPTNGLDNAPYLVLRTCPCGSTLATYPRWHRPAHRPGPDTVDGQPGTPQAGGALQGLDG